MTKSILEKIKDKVKTVSDKTSCIEGYTMDVNTQYKIVFEHFRLANIGFGVPHSFWDLGEAIFDFWFDTLNTNNTTVVSTNKQKLREAINEEMKSEPTDENMKVRISIDNLLKKKYTFIDLFAGCGGLSEGFYREGFEALAHVEIDHWACETLRTRMKFYGYKDYEKEVLEYDITSKDILEKIDSAVNDRTVDIIIGGPPCQAYSTAGRVRAGRRMATDPRNYLFESYVKILEHYLPKYFVFENVTGLLSAQVNGAPIFPRILKALGMEYKVIGNPDILVHNTADYGVPQLRKRIIIIGVRKDIDKDPLQLYQDIVKTHWNPEIPENERKGKKRFVDVKQAIGDLPPVEPGCDASMHEYNYPCNNEFLKKIGKKGIHPLMDHVARRHNDLDRERFQVMIHNHWSFGQLRRAMPQYEHEHARVFDNSYVVQWWDLPSKTILAHIHKDGFQFIHPDEVQRRTFTVREAARIQSFPDDFEFKGSRSEKYKQIGNAVPPLFAEALAKSVRKNLDNIEL